MRSLFRILLFIVPTIGFSQDQVMYVHYIDMGQGLATLIQFPKGVIMIDAGSQIKSRRSESQQKVVRYLRRFFNDNKHYKNTIHSIIVTHNHQDHTGTILNIYDEFKVKNIVTTEFNEGEDVDVPGVKKMHIDYDDVLKKKGKGLSNSSIDPLKAFQGFDPKITVYSGMNPDFTSDSESPNNHSIVTKVEFGRASFIFTGDLETKGIRYLLEKYSTYPDALRADVYQVGHHGSPNATTKPLLDAIKPKTAIISASHKNDVSGGSGWDYGHPRDNVVSMLASVLPNNRSSPITGHVYREEETNPYNVNIAKAVYCTCWDGSIVIRATPDGKYSVATGQ